MYVLPTRGTRHRSKSCWKLVEVPATGKLGSSTVTSNDTRSSPRLTSKFFSWSTYSIQFLTPSPWSIEYLFHFIFLPHCHFLGRCQMLDEVGRINTFLWILGRQYNDATFGFRIRNFHTNSPIRHTFCLICLSFQFLEKKENPAYSWLQQHCHVFSSSFDKVMHIKLWTLYNNLLNIFYGDT